jgi:TonB family protein
MKRPLIRDTCFLCAVAILSPGSTPAWAQPDSPPKPVSPGAQAVAVVLKHYALNPSAHLSTTGLPLPTDGSWSLSKARPAACPATEEKCVEVFYDVPAASVRCSWVVLLNADGADGQFLDENDSAATYLKRIVSRSEAIALVNTRKNPVYPPIAVAARVQGDVFVNGSVGKLGDSQNIRVLSGNAMLQGAAMEAAKQWTFKPLMVGSRAVPYQVKLVFKFQLIGDFASFQSAKGDVAP